MNKRNLSVTTAIVVVSLLLAAPFSLHVLAQNGQTGVQGTDVSDLQLDINQGDQDTAAQAELQQSEDDSQVQEGDGQNNVVTENTTADVPAEIQTQSVADVLPPPQQTTEQPVTPDNSQPDLGQDASGQTPDTGAQPVDNSGGSVNPSAPGGDQTQPTSTDNTGQ